MTKKLSTILSTLTLALTSQIFANNECYQYDSCCTQQSNSFRSSLYVGLAGSFTHLSADRYDTIVGVNEELNSSISSLGAAVSPFFGYLYRLPNSNLVFAPEVAFEFPFLNNKSGSLENLPNEYQVKHKFSVAPSIRLGYVFCDEFMIYATLGGKVTRFKYKAFSKGDTRPVTTDKKYRAALTYGIGIEKEINCNHRIRFQFSRSHYESLKFIAIHDDGGIANSHYTAATNEITVAYSYAF